MSKAYRKLVVTIFIFSSSVAYCGALKIINSMDLPGSPGKRFDYLKIDPDNHYLFSAHLGNNQTYVIDLKIEKLLKVITDTPGVEGIEYVPEGHKIYTSNWRDKTIGVIDLSKMKVIKKIPAYAKPDGSAYASPFHKLYVSDERAKKLIVIDIVKDVVIKTLDFKSETGMTRFDPVKKKIYLNLQDQNLFAVINPETDTLEGTFPIDKCHGNHGMALDSANHLAFLACEENNLISVFNLDLHKVVSDISIPDGVDVLEFDPGLKRLYAACYSGFISIIQEETPSKFKKLEDFKVQATTHSLAIDPETHKVYAPTQEADGQPASRLYIYAASVP